MAKTPVDLYRRGNTNSPRMDNIRLGKEMVRGLTSGGISTFSIQGKGKNWWRIDAGTDNERLLLVEAITQSIRKETNLIAS